MIDTNKLYLFNNGWGYKIGKIRRINTKTVTMDNGDKFEIDKLDQKLYQLTEKEERLYRSELIKSLSWESRSSLEKLLSKLKQTKSFLENCEFVDLNTKKLQKYIDETTEEIKKEIDFIIMEIKDKKFKLDERSYIDKLCEE